MDNKFVSLVAILALWIGPSVAVGVGLYFLFGIPWWATALIGIGVQWFFNYWQTYQKEYKKIEAALEKYENLNYKQYRIPLTCQACGRPNDVELDLTNTEFSCVYCERENAIYVNFSTAVKTDPVYDMQDFIANAT